ncbi:MAG: tyrosine-type recombinase/integrase [Fuerstiella sp.]|nr:tyrosine-type recombinase/integrase [Fuerstiella sp.]
MKGGCITARWHLPRRDALTCPLEFLGIPVRASGLVTSLETGTNIAPRTVEWAQSLSDALKKKLAKADLIQLDAATEMPQLETFVNAWITSRTEVKESSRLVYGRARNWLVKFFGKDRSIDTITAGDADDWKRYMLQDIGKNTARKMSGVAKQMFRYAVRKQLIEEDPFTDLPSAVGSNEKLRRFIPAAVIDRIIGFAPDAEWRLIIALARYGGLRTPSETFRLQWKDVNFERGRIFVTEPEVEHHDGRGLREMPLFPELRPYLEDAFNIAADKNGCVSPDRHIIGTHRPTSGNLSTEFHRIIRRAGEESWPRIFQNLRASRQTELEKQHGMKAACEWLGNSPKVANRHYLTVTEEDFGRALELTPKLTPDITGQEVSEQDRVTTTKVSLARKNADSSTKNGAAKQNLTTPFSGPNWTRTSDLHDVKVSKT